MPELKSYICPNCGANTTNSQNCEYCGSLLVRFVEKGIDLSHTTYTNNDHVFPGLLGELKLHLKLQNEGQLPQTALFKKINNKYYDEITIDESFIFEDDPNESDEYKGLRIKFEFNRNEEKSVEYNDRKDVQLSKFRQLDSYPLFTPHFYYDEVNNDGTYVRAYSIHFGTDAEGAARLISEVLNKVYGWSPTEPFDMFTTENLDVEETHWLEAHGFNDSEEDDEVTDDSTYDEESDVADDSYSVEEEVSNNQKTESYNKKGKDKEEIVWYWYLIGGIGVLLFIFIKHLLFS